MLMETTNHKVQVAIIIVAYNGRADLEHCLPSVIAATQNNHERHIIVVDNASSDGSANLADNFTAIEVIRQETNLGFAAGNNVALRLALERDYDYAVLLNQDTVVEARWLEELVAGAESNHDAGAIQSLITLYPDVDKINSWGNSLHYLGFGFAGGNGQSIKLAPTEVCDIAYPSGATVLLRVKALRALGILDEFLFMYHEDLELGWRMWMSGWKVLIAPDSIVHHAYTFRKSADKFYLMERNRWLVLLTHWQWGTILVLLPMLLIMEIGQLIFSAGRGEFRKRLGLYSELLSSRTQSYICNQRRYLDKLRCRPDRAILRWCVGTIQFQELHSMSLRIVNPIMEIYFSFAKLIIWW
jgi:GT2 family glycosyltransferase